MQDLGLFRDSSRRREKNEFLSSLSKGKGMSEPTPTSSTVAVNSTTVPVQLGADQPWYLRVPSLRRLVFFSVFIFLMAIATMVGGFAYIQHVVTPMAESGSTSITPPIFEPEERGRVVFRDRERINILVLGIDYNYTNQGILYTKGARSDTILVVSLNRDAEFLNVVSIPRDTQVLISEEFGYDKINGAYALGGIEQALETVSEFLEIPLHHYVIVKVRSASQIIDAIDGLPINVEKNMDYDDNWGNLHIHLKKGPQVLNGQQAVGYARFRMDEEGDRGRIRRQQQVVRALGQKLKDPSIIPRLHKIAPIVKENVETDLKIIEMVDLAQLYVDFDFSKMRTGTIVGDDAETNGITFIVPYEPENRKTVRRLLKDSSWIAKSDFRLRVLNGSKDSQAGNRLADQLHVEGMNVVEVATADRSDYEATEVIEHRHLPRARAVMMSVVPGADYRQAYSEQDPPYDLTIVVGNDRAVTREAWNPPPRNYPVYEEPPRQPEPAPEPEEFYPEEEDYRDDEPEFFDPPPAEEVVPPPPEEVPPPPVEEVAPPPPPVEEVAPPPAPLEETIAPPPQPVELPPAPQATPLAPPSPSETDWTSR